MCRASGSARLYNPGPGTRATGTATAMSLVVGIDVGTQSVKLVAYDPATRQVVAIHGEPLELIAGDGGVREQRAEWWIAAIRACFARLPPALRARIVAVGVSGQQHGFV